MVLMPLELARSFLTLAEQARLAGVDQALWLELRLHLKASFLQQQLRRLTQQAWMNAVLNDAKRFHAFFNRLRINLEELEGFRCSLYEIEFAKRRRRDVRLERVRLCPLCRCRAVDAACYVAFGDKMVSSTPFLIFNCRRCMKPEMLLDSFDIYQAPRICFLSSGSKRSGRVSASGELTWGFC